MLHSVWRLFLALSKRPPKLGLCGVSLEYLDHYIDSHSGDPLPIRLCLGLQHKKGQAGIRICYTLMLLVFYV